ncbi:poly(A) polymerase [Achromatium sp. WMS3]|nr:poly(A) polymerase [Achromatium sp. WMS3]
MSPSIIPRYQHTISRSNISPSALKVLYRLKEADFQAYLVGGAVRDLLLGREPKDFDIATNATPEQIRKIFRNSRLIGRRFRLAHVYFGEDIVEVATFRGSGADTRTNDNLADAELANLVTKDLVPKRLTNKANSDRERLVEDGMIIRDNLYGTIEEDAIRRDFTINALYYNIADFSVLDFAGGIADLNQKCLRLIGEPELRYREDPVRMLRALRFICKLGFNIAPECEAPLWTLGKLLNNVSTARLFEEVQKLLLNGNGLSTFEKLRHYGLFAYLFPATEASFRCEECALNFVNQGLINTDLRVQSEKAVSPAFLYAILLWEPVRLRELALEQEGQRPTVAVTQAINEILKHQGQYITIPKRFTLPIREIWALQYRFENRRGQRAYRVLSQPRFRSAYDFLLLRASIGEVDGHLADWWMQFKNSTTKDRHLMVQKETQRPRRMRNRARSKK